MLSSHGPPIIAQVHAPARQAGMELRVLYAAAHRLTWYGQWQYAFGRGAFNISRRSWQSSVDKIHAMSLEAIKADFQKFEASPIVLEIIDRYQVRLSHKQAALLSTLCLLD